MYVDDIVIKSKKASDHLADLQKVFNVLKAHRMKLNSAKCIFEVPKGKFLGYMVSQYRIKANSEKI